MSQPNPPKSNEAGQDETRRRILQAALALFGQVGYARATTRLIAQTAEVNEVTLFRHFGNKKNLLQACVQTHNAQGFASTFEAGLSGDYAEDIRLMARLQGQDTRANLDLLRLLLCESRNLPELRQALMEGGRGNLKRLSDYFQRQIELGVVRVELSPNLLASAFDSLFSSPLLFESLFQDSLFPEQDAEETLEQLADLFVRGTIRAIPEDLENP